MSSEGRTCRALGIRSFTPAELLYPFHSRIAIASCSKEQEGKYEARAGLIGSTPSLRSDRPAGSNEQAAHTKGYDGTLVLEFLKRTHGAPEPCGALCAATEQAAAGR